ncbi:MAG: hypothetical protein HYV29_07300 [Ignavibacteriales bacterium]|nr:hypothetical protein [Ignavibacteriales bacterium]
MKICASISINATRCAASGPAAAARLHDKAFGPLVYDLIQLVEFENDLKATEKMYKDLLK